ncbi:tetratricopeptide repeat protein [Psychromarinibacter sp. C21-152]|uniref:Tetratricopeptide repeat protein n=1 Tax=Psychromarinibacter sediminicola TaxID=3033385 RepID=A0AAE3NPT0_9RHOB|nr:tetratricopeptide repeat protein [Psychromarinibacter sediminicola]MDF0599802.1 tetratricopeptide repeat protein [Psychromarinibacter sediminicola]
MRHRWPGLLLVITALAACSGTGGLRTSDGLFAPAVDTSRDNVDGLVVGHRLMAGGEYELALKAYYRAAAAQGMTVDVLSAVGSANLRLGRLNQAENLLRRALDTDQTFVPAWNNLGVVLMETGRYGEAERVFHTAFALDNGESAAIRENLRLALAKLENPSYDAENKSQFALVRRGSGEYRLLATP